MESQESGCWIEAMFMDRGFCLWIRTKWHHPFLILLIWWALKGISCGSCAAAAKSLQSCPTLCDPIEGSLLGSPILGILQARTLKWVAISFSNAWKWKVKVQSLNHIQLRDCSLPGSSIHGIFQTRVLEWGAEWDWRAWKHQDFWYPFVHCMYLQAFTLL